jgi:hypothetical protein
VFSPPSSSLIDPFATSYSTQFGAHKMQPMQPYVTVRNPKHASLPPVPEPTFDPSTSYGREFQVDSSPLFFPAYNWRFAQRAADRAL